MTKDVFLSVFVISYIMMVSWVLLQVATVVLLDSFTKAASIIEHEEEAAMLAKKGSEHSLNPLDPLLKKLSEEFIDEDDLHARLQKLFKVDHTTTRHIAQSIAR